MPVYYLYPHHMKRTSLKIILILAGLAIGGIFIVQFFWFKKAFDLRNKQFNQTVHIALTEVAQDILNYNGHSTLAPDAVTQPATNYFIAMVNDVIDAQLLRQLLIRSFLKRNIHQDFEFGIYDCQTQSMVYGHYVAMSDSGQALKKGSLLPRWDRENYYFIVHFPGKEANLIAEMNIWLFSTGVLFIVLIFFAYALFALLQHQKISRLQKDFINNMTHELKTPLTGISLAGEGLRHMLKDPKQLRYVEIIEEEAKKLRNHTQRILEAAITEEHGLRLHCVRIDLNTFLKEQIKLWADRVKESEARLTFQEAEQPMMVLADELHLSNALSGLIDNALKYAGPKPEIRLQLSIDQGFARIDVSDKGEGIAAEHQKKIFERFYRVPTGDKQGARGFGLGLHYVWLVMAAHKGQVTVKSKPGQGTVFSLFLPR